ncbi:MAG: redoxin family protein [Ignavibacteria bacterium]|nr:redoxin family protein [Ignavibacteria bacterium]
MKINVIITIALAVVLSVTPTFSAGNLTITPTKPTINSKITISYTPDKKFAGSSKLTAALYVFNETEAQPTAYEVALEPDKSKKLFAGSIQMPKNAVFALLKVGDGKQYDNNDENYWEQLVFIAAGFPVRGANVRAAVSLFGSLPEPCRRRADITRAREFLKEEVLYFKDNIQAQIGLLSLKFEAKEVTKDEYDAALQKIVDGYFDRTKESEVRSITRALRVLNKLDKSADLERQFIETNPRSEFAEEVTIGRLSSAKDEESFIAASIDFLKNFPTSSYYDRVATSVINSAIKKGNYQQLKEYFGENSKASTAALTHIAGALGEIDSMLPAAQSWSARSLDAAEKTGDNAKPKFITSTEWKQTLKITQGDAYATNGFILKRLNKLPESLSSFEKARKLLADETPADVYENMLEVLDASGKQTEALALADDAIRMSKASENLLEQHKKLFEFVWHGSKSYDSLFKILNSKVQTGRKTKLLAEKTNLLAIGGKFTSLDGKTLDLTAQKGKVIVLDYWATWCGPCRASFPALQKLYDKYKDNPNVVFAVVDVWERVPDRKKAVEEYLSKNPSYKFPVYLDETDAVVKKFGVTGIPTKFYIGKNGAVQFKEVGFAGEERFLEEAQDKISLLLEE